MIDFYDDGNFTNMKFEIYIDRTLLKYDFTDDEKEILRPIAETLAVLDGNAFFGQTLDRDGKEAEWYEQYLSEAHYLFEHCGGKNPNASWNHNYEHPAVRDAWENFKIMKRLTK